MEDNLSNKIRLAVFSWLEKIAIQYEHVLDWQILSQGFRFENISIPLIGAKGIWKPKVIKQFPISITSVPKSNYSDEFITEDLLYYSYRGTAIMHSDNIGLRECMNYQIPLVYLHQIVKGKYFVAWPIFVVGDEPQKLRFTVSVESREVIFDNTLLQDPISEYRRKYKTRQILVRLHQKSFRERVLKAYQNHCTICNLKHRVLLDAAHIIPDYEGGKPEVNNGLALCKIHHAAYDQNIIGISPDYRIKIRTDILDEIDGPMLRHGLQEFHQQSLILPRSKQNLPNREWLDKRYSKFLSA